MESGARQEVPSSVISFPSREVVIADYQNSGCIKKRFDPVPYPGFIWGFEYSGTVQLVLQDAPFFHSKDPRSAGSFFERSELSRSIPDTPQDAWHDRLILGNQHYPIVRIANS